MQLQLLKHTSCSIILSVKVSQTCRTASPIYLHCNYMESEVISTVVSQSHWDRHGKATNGVCKKSSHPRHACSFHTKQLVWAPLRVDCIVYDVVEVYSPLLLATQQSKSGFRQKPRRPSCPDEPKMGVGWAKWISSPLQSSKGTRLLPFQMPNWEQSQPQSIALAALWFWIWSMRKKGQLPDDKGTQPDLS